MASLSQKRRSELSGKSVSEVRRERLHIYTAVNKANGQTMSMVLTETQAQTSKASGEFDNFIKVV